jgi:hypothetical protein
MGSTDFNFENELNDIFDILELNTKQEYQCYRSDINCTSFKISKNYSYSLIIIDIESLGVSFQRFNNQEIKVTHGLSNQIIKNKGLIKDIREALNNKKLV